MASEKVQVDLIGLFSKAIIEGFRALKIMLNGGNDYDHIITILFIRLKIYVETLENHSPTKSYPTLIKKEDQTFYYKLPLGLPFKKIKDNVDAFNDAFKPHTVKITELESDTKAHFSIEVLKLS